MKLKPRPLVRYPGSKAKKCETLMTMIPPFEGEWYEPFGGSTVVSNYFQEMYPNKTVHTNDLYTDLFNLYLQVKNNVDEFINLALQVREDYDRNNIELRYKLFDDMTDWVNNGDDLHRAVGFYVRNKISFSGLSSGPSQDSYQNMFNVGNIKKVRLISKLYQKMIFTNLDYREFLKDVKPNDFVFLDPPYDIKDFLYGEDGSMHDGFSHKDFADFVKSLPCKWIITYNDNESLREYFKDYNIYDEKYFYSMAFEHLEDGTKKQREANELIITNYDRDDHKSTLDDFFV